MTVSVLELFKPQVVALWATAYTFEPDTFDDFLLRKLGEPPLNVNILVDAGRIGRIWEEWADQPWRFRRINREYLVRPVPWPGHAFHPKTYMVATKAGGSLAVGSGNLGLQGVVRGNEVFCAFSAATEFGRLAIGSWRTWMQRLVMRIDDALLTQRWGSFVAGAPWLPPPHAGSAFLHNLDHPILSQFLDAITAPVDELHVLAPFFDADVGALAALLGGTSPKSLYLYLPRDVSVHGARLLQVLSRAPGAVHLRSLDGEAFVHAKSLLQNLGAGC